MRQAIESNKNEFYQTVSAAKQRPLFGICISHHVISTAGHLSTTVWYHHGQVGVTPPGGRGQSASGVRGARGLGVEAAGGGVDRRGKAPVILSAVAYVQHVSRYDIHDKHGIHDIHGIHNIHDIHAATTLTYNGAMTHTS